jgi:hypothetical protein
MTRLVKSLVLSTAVAASTLVPVLEASAGERWREHRPRHPSHHQRHDDTGALVAAGILGLALGIIATTAATTPDTTIHDYPDTTYFPPAPHGGTTYAYQGSIEPWTREWYPYCATRYRSFDPQTGTFRGYDGYDHFCVAD